MKGDEGLIYAVVGTRRGGGGGGGVKYEERASGVALGIAAFGRAALWVSVWRGAFVHVGSTYRRTMIGDVFGVVKGGFSGI